MIAFERLQELIPPPRDGRVGIDGGIRFDAKRSLKATEELGVRNSVHPLAAKARGFYLKQGLFVLTTALFILVLVENVP